MNIQKIVEQNVFKFYVPNFELSSLVVLKSLITKTNAIQVYFCCNAVTMKHLCDNVKGFTQSLRRDETVTLFAMNVLPYDLKDMEILMFAPMSDDLCTSLLFSIDNGQHCLENFDCEIVSTSLKLESLPVN